jgi:hypothetical protein
MPRRFSFLLLALSSIFFACKAEKPVEHKKPEPVVIKKQKPLLLSTEQRRELGFPAELIGQVELAAGAEAEPFFAIEVIPSENMKGEKGFERERLAGFSVHTNGADELIANYRAPLRAKGFLIFRSFRSYGGLHDIVTIVKGVNSYDILKIQRTEAPNYNLDTMSIIVWLKEQQKEGPFVVTGAGSDWLETQFIKPPKDMPVFVKQVADFAPDVLLHGPRAIDERTERMKRTNGFYLVWD